MTKPPERRRETREVDVGTIDTNLDAPENLFDGKVITEERLDAIQKAEEDAYSQAKILLGYREQVMRELTKAETYILEDRE